PSDQADTITIALILNREDEIIEAKSKVETGVSKPHGEAKAAADQIFERHWRTGRLKVRVERPDHPVRIHEDNVQMAAVEAKAHPFAAVSITGDDCDVNPRRDPRVEGIKMWVGSERFRADLRIEIDQHQRRAIRRSEFVEHVVQAEIWP